MQRTIAPERPVSRAPALPAHRISAEHITLALLVAASAIAGVCLAWAPVKFLVGHAMYDDGFYYLQIARNIVHGHGVSADGEVWTNGFHPLWMLILLPVYALPLSADNSLHVALSVSALIVSGSGILLYMTARRLHLSAIASLACVAFYLLNPVVLFMSVDGLETGVNLAAFIAFLYAYIVARQEPTPRHQILASAAAGVLVLSRTDYGIVAALMLAALLARDRSLRAALRLSLPSIVVTAPWFIWNFVVFGSVLQDSAGAIPYVNHHSGLAASGAAPDIAVAALFHLLSGTFRLAYIWMIPRGAFSLLIPFFLLSMIVAARAMASGTNGRRGLALIALPAGGLAIVLVIHGAIRWSVRDWYLMPIVPLFALFVGLAVDASRSAGPTRRRIVPMLALLVLVIGVKTATQFPRGAYPYPEQDDLLAAARWVRANTPENTRVGSFNSGIMAYYSGRTTVNLDGVVNPDADAAMHRHGLLAYVRDEHLDVIVDYSYFVCDRYAPFFGAPLQSQVGTTFNSEVGRYQGPVTVYDVSSTLQPELTR